MTSTAISFSRVRILRKISSYWGRAQLGSPEYSCHTEDEAETGESDEPEAHFSADSQTTLEFRFFLKRPAQAFGLFRGQLSLRLEVLVQEVEGVGVRSRKRA